MLAQFFDHATAALLSTYLRRRSSAGTSIIRVINIPATTAPPQARLPPKSGGILSDNPINGGLFKN